MTEVYVNKVLVFGSIPTETDKGTGVIWLWQVNAIEDFTLGFKGEKV